MYVFISFVTQLVGANLECANSIIDIYTATYSKNAVDVCFEGWVYGV
jgi:hypothetical protein